MGRSYTKHITWLTNYYKQTNCKLTSGAVFTTIQKEQISQTTKAYMGLATTTTYKNITEKSKSTILAQYRENKTNIAEDIWKDISLIIKKTSIMKLMPNKVKQTKSK